MEIHIYIYRYDDLCIYIEEAAIDYFMITWFNLCNCFMVVRKSTKNSLYLLKKNLKIIIFLEKISENYYIFIEKIYENYNDQADQAGLESQLCHQLLYDLVQMTKYSVLQFPHL